MFSPDDTIVAIATPRGRGGLGVVRISGGQATDIARSLLTYTSTLEPRRAVFTRFIDSGFASTADEVVALYFPAPRSFTGQDTVEISAHGSPVVLDAIVRAAMRAGARLAEPGEFTLRAFLNGKRDLVQAEAVADLIDAATPLQARVAFDQLEGTLTRRIGEIDARLFDLIARLEASLDFPDEGYHFVSPEDLVAQITAVIDSIDSLLSDATRGRMIREGSTVVVVGRPNVGKSSLFNCLCGSDRAIVTAVPGTTRDLIAERIDIGGLAVTLVDTAGARDTFDVVEKEGVARGLRALGVADLVLVVIDASESPNEDDVKLLARTADRRRLVVANKCDRAEANQAAQAWADSDRADLRVSALTGEGIGELRRAIERALTTEEPLRDTVSISNARHIALLEAARDHLGCARHAGLEGAMPEEFVLADLQAARARFDEIVGRRTVDDVLVHIFERFCIGK